LARLLKLDTHIYWSPENNYAFLTGAFDSIYCLELSLQLQHSLEEKGYEIERVSEGGAVAWKASKR